LARPALAAPRSSTCRAPVAATSLCATTDSKA
jgi:hypothetical protein